VLLVLACLIPRAWAAWRWEVLWGDSLVYLRASEALDQGDLPRALDDLGLNLYPLILCGLHRLPIDWTAAASGWSLLMACAAVLPLWGWIRRQFNDRVAVAACLCYAFQGQFVANAPLILRDATFWFLWAATLYSLWRAIVEIRLAWFLAAGAALTLAVYTRSEGWLLVVPLLGWSAGRCWKKAEGELSVVSRQLSVVGCQLQRTTDNGRRAPIPCPLTPDPADRNGRSPLTPSSLHLRLAAGVLLCLAMVPATLVAVNMTCLREHPRWELLRPRHVQIIWQWWRSQAADAARPAPPAAGAAVAASPAPPSPHGSPAALNWKLVERCVRGHTYVGALLMLVGLCLHGRLLLRRDHLALAAMNILLLVLIRIRHAQEGSDVRYFMPMVLAGLPWMALGFFGIVAAAAKRLSPWIGASPARYALLLGALAVLAAALGVVDGRPSAGRVREIHRQMAMGRWLLDRVGPGQVVGGSAKGLELMAYYAQARATRRFAVPRAEALPAVVAAADADAVLLRPEDMSGYAPAAEAPAGASQMLSQLGYRRIALEDLPPDCDMMAVLIRR
jgi:hypothetical protein